MKRKRDLHSPHHEEETRHNNLQGVLSISSQCHLEDNCDRGVPARRESRMAQPFEGTESHECTTTDDNATVICSQGELGTSSSPVNSDTTDYTPFPGREGQETSVKCVSRPLEILPDHKNKHHGTRQGLSKMLRSVNPTDFNRETLRSFSFNSSSATFSTGISIENTFNRNSILILERPYESLVFTMVQEGDIPAVTGLLEAGNASIYDVDPYGLGLLYYASYYCWKIHGAERAVNMCFALLAFGVSTQWTDDIGNTPMETMLDSALIYSAVSGGAAFEFGRLCADIGSCFGMTLADTGAQYLETRGFSDLHQVLLGINRTVELSDYLNSLDQQNLSQLINLADTRGRTPLTWAAEFGWSDAVQILLGFGANPNCLQRGNLTPLHLAVAGPKAQFFRTGFPEVINLLLKAGADINARDCQGWTPLHIAASWGIFDLPELFSRADLNWDVVTDDNMSVNDLSPIEGFSNVVLTSLDKR